MAGTIVHIGFHKTGTTWFQECVYPRVKGFRYVPRKLTQSALLEPSAFAFDAERAAKALGASSGPLILCEENLSGYPHSGGLHGFLTRAMAQRIRDALPDARIVMFLRNQPEMIAACYQQYVRGGGTFPAQRYLWPAEWLHGAEARPFKIPRFSFDYFEYDRVVAHYQGLFGAERVHVFPFEALQRDAGDFLPSFARRLELKLDLASVPLAKRNPSYSPAGLALMRALNRLTARSVNDKRHWLHIPRWYSLRRRVIEPLNRSGLLGARASAERVLGVAALRWIEQRYVESNRRLAQLVPFDLAALGYPLEPPATPVEPPQRARWRRFLVK
jgi:hypothetical protein